MIKKSIQFIFLFILLGIALSTFYIYRQLMVVVGERTDKIAFEVKTGESASTLATHLKENQIIKSSFFFKLYLKQKGLDKKIQSGIFQMEPPFTIPRVASALSAPENNERSITLIPGWDLRDIAKYFVEEKIIINEKELFDLTGNVGKYENVTSSLTEKFSILVNKPDVSIEGYLAPETYRIYKNEKIEDVLSRLVNQRQKEFTVQMLEDIQKQGKTVHEILTLASIVEKEVKTPEDRKKVADLFWRRVEIGMGLQADSTVHYLSGREGDVFTKAKERQIDSLYNTYKYRGLPPGPISNPSVSSIMATIYPEKNDAWYFLTTTEGEVKYGKTLDEHNANVQKYLR